MSVSAATMNDMLNGPVGLSEDEAARERHADRRAHVASQAIGGRALARRCLNRMPDPFRWTRDGNRARRYGYDVLSVSATEVVEMERLEARSITIKVDPELVGR